ncbi:MAG: phosphoribosylformylglycinamidine synthase [Planctomycetes bacterium]|jgi:phosphoribosylformylglycinamidine synthase|nr:phosphoribosylformylglycinamidine synthase [Planctomycetota bacterium]MDP6407868.1 phosphoribosylformylglycinamidine synthase subunit PurQ [Planctomycetota bacterium]
MSAPRALVLRAAGTNCDGETARALELGGATAAVWHLERLVAEPDRLEQTEILVLAGGFSHGDDVGAGRVWGLDLRRRLQAELWAFVERGGLVLGICNGFQALLESGLFAPRGSAAAERDVALTANTSNHYECRWVSLESLDCVCPWIVAGERWPVPVAHAEGRFAVADGGVVERLRAAGQVALSYVAPGGGPAEYPANPNGSVADIAGICDASGRVLGLMPHPERNVSPWHHPRWTRMEAREEGEGLIFFRRMVAVAAGVSV